VVLEKNLEVVETTLRAQEPISTVTSEATFQQAS